MFNLSIATDNDAFGPSPEDRAAEIARILRGIAAYLTDRPQYFADGGEGNAHDINGHTVCTWSLTIKTTED